MCQAAVQQIGQAIVYVFPRQVICLLDGGIVYHKLHGNCDFTLHRATVITAFNLKQLPNWLCYNSAAKVSFLNFQIFQKQDFPIFSQEQNLLQILCPWLMRAV